MTLSRRQLLSAISVAGTTVLAGCTFSANLGGDPSGTLFVDVVNEGEEDQTVTVVLLDDSDSPVDEWPETVVPANTSKSFRFDSSGGPFEARVESARFASAGRWDPSTCTKERFVTRVGVRDGTPYVTAESRCEA
ncbi:hypothetical protein [Haloarchaeobius sp. TZWWS8]|uniref:hypothetical protein n=1 Tax=Haloarchaeobius sp. TZWWS8 TaxID=3446121 RepID=UPI003EBF5A70